MADPQIGEMILYDDIQPSLLAGEYRMTVETDVSVPGTATPLPGQDFFFDVEGPRFALSPTEVAGVFPPRGGHGPFDSALPHIALGRRTLPWERPLADAYTVTGDETPYPFVALVLLESAECTLLRNQALTDVVPPDVFQRLGRPGDIRCDAVEADQQLLRAILPMPDELRLLTHVRQVNVDDRELSAADSDGYFAVVMGNRNPRPGGSYVACLVSVEERTDLLPTTDLVAGGGWQVYENPEIAPLSEPADLAGGALGVQVTPEEADRIRVIPPGGGTVTTGGPAVPGAGAHPASTGAARAVTASAGAVSQASLAVQAPGLFQATQVGAIQAAGERDRLSSGAGVLNPPARLVLLHSWTFTCEGDGTFRQLMQGLDVGMIGDTDPASKLTVADTGHILLGVTDRLGAPEQSWYRGPLVSQPLTRDPLGPYHSADQARRVVAETGAENISYACAFETGRLLAAADGRLAQELMRWRRTAFRASARTTSITLLQHSMRFTQVTDPLDPVALQYAVDVLQKITDGISPPADPLRIQQALATPLLNLDLVTKAFGLRNTDEARVLLGDDPGLTGPVTVRAPEAALTTLDAVLSDKAGMAALADVRARAIASVQPVSPAPAGTPPVPGTPPSHPAAHPPAQPPTHPPTEPEGPR